MEGSLRHGLALPESVLNRISYEVAHLSQGLVSLKASGDQPSACVNRGKPQVLLEAP